jgi:hypothetical protein
MEMTTEKRTEIAIGMTVQIKIELTMEIITEKTTKFI